jgi:hypothetical protein
MRAVKVIRGVSSVEIRQLRLAVALVATGALCLALPGIALANGGPPVLNVTVVPVPTVFSTFHTATCSSERAFQLCDTYEVIVKNIGGSATEGELTISDVLPEHVSLAEGGASGTIEGLPEHELTCEASTVSCTYAGALPPDASLSMQIRVDVEPEAPNELVDTATVTGGGAATAQASSTTTTGEASGPSRFTNFTYEPTTEAGLLDVQAGAHPYRLTIKTFLQSQLGRERDGVEPAEAIESIKNLVYYLPLGSLGNPQVLPKCSAALLAETSSGFNTACPPSSQVGVILLAAFGNLVPNGQTVTHEASIFNMVPEKGYPAEFGFLDNGIVIALYVSVVRYEGTYRLRVAVPGIPRTARLFGSIATFFGNISEEFTTAEGEIAERQVGAFLTNPSVCGTPGPSATAEATTWENPGGESIKAPPATAYPEISGCGLARLPATLNVQPNHNEVDQPSGYNFSLAFPQAPNFAPNIGTPPLQNVSVTLPQGVTLSPSSANGLGACQETGPEGINLEAESIGADGLSHPERGHCPSDSQIATVQITSPLLSEQLAGHLYLAAPRCGGTGEEACNEGDAENGKLFSLYLEAEAPTAGVNLKLRGMAAVNPTTGQVTTSFDDNPQFPVSELVVKTTDGPRAPLANPQSCGNGYEVTSDITPWGAPGTADATPTSDFSLTGCASPMPFAPSFSAGTVVANGGATSPFTMTIARSDGQQDIAGVGVTLPEGLVGLLSQVPLCEEPAAAAGSCPEASRIGSTSVAAGAGTSPYWLSGSVYLTGPYNGAPFGLSIVVPAQAGPFNLGNVVVQAAISINPVTTAVTVTSGPIPQMRDGIPFRLKTINVTIDRPGFMLNPTDCTAKSVTGTISAAQGATATVSSPFAVGGCSKLSFKPTLVATTQGSTSKLNGGSFDVKLSYPPTDAANVRQVKVDLPISLPSRLTTLQQACRVAVFNSNPALCPTHSVVGMAKAVTPALPLPLTGPAYLVSYAGEAFPALVVVLQGDGVTVDLTGQTDIKKGITSSAFKAVPDAPVSSFELYLPEGRYSLLAATGNLCKQKLKMPTRITGQNGAVISQTTTIQVTGCPKAKPAKKAKKKAKAKK